MKKHTPKYLGKLAPEWVIHCRVKNDRTEPGEEYFVLSFTMNSYSMFTPPDGHVKDFHICAQLFDSYPKVKTGIYRNSDACCLVQDTSEGKSLHAVSHQWEKLREFTAHIVSDAGMQPFLSCNDPTFQDKFQMSWTAALLSLPKE